MSGNAAKGTRLSVLWGSGKRDGTRESVLWGKGGRTALLAIVAAFVALAAPWAASAHQLGPKHDGTDPSEVYISSSLLSDVEASPNDRFAVIVQGDGSRDADRVAKQIAHFAADADKKLGDAAKKADDALAKAQRDADELGRKAADAQAKADRSGKPRDRDDAAKAKAAADAAQVDLAAAQAADVSAQAGVSQLAGKILEQQITDEFSSISGVAATLTGRQIEHLVDKADSGLLSITLDAPVRTSGWKSNQLWPYASFSADNWGMDGDHNFQDRMPSIAIVDSGIENRPDFAGRIVASVDLSTIPGHAPGDGRGHGTFVAGIAAGAGVNYAGANPVAKLVDVKVMDSTGMGYTSDIIRACQWILDHQFQYDIRVANFSLHSDITAPFYVDPLDRAVEQLWFHNVVVVAAAGNYGSEDGATGVNFSPGNDPFVITVGAVDVGTKKETKDDSIAPWSAWGSTPDGFAKPELSAPGRYMVAPVPAGATLITDHPGNVVAPGYMELSGTSFAAPVVSAAVAQMLAKNPGWTPDQVKGALMLTATPLPPSAGTSGGVGELNARDAVKGAKTPNPNLGLRRFVGASGSGTSASYSFDGASWHSVAGTNASWNSASWNSDSWSSASWNSASWNSASWNSASWNSASWHSASWNSTSAEDAAEDDAAPVAAITLSPDDVAAMLATAEASP